ncbi:MAG: ABC transporter ATP-binding protein, partial [Bdellovibrionales bacterium]|nr:ABC transporter ATP-binding protein [Bdellovibrionales bacterium]
MLKSAKSNAIVHLAMVMWNYAKGYRRTVVVYVLLAIGAVCADLCLPLVIGKLMNAVQSLRGEALMTQAFWLCLAYVGIGFVFEVLHRPSRILEVGVAFRVKKAMQSDLFRKVTKLPMRWQRDNHSGDIIDQVARATESMKYATESGFEVIHVITRVIGSIIALVYLMWAAGFAVIVSGSAAVAVILLIDKYLVAQYEVLNKRFNKIAASIQDYLTNVGTVISLRLEERVSNEVDQRTDRLHKEVVRNAMTNEFKWFSASRFVQLTQISVLYGYLYVMEGADTAIEFGTVFTLWRYLTLVGESFYHFTWKYGELVMLNTRVRAVEHIDESYQKLVTDEPDLLLPQGWETLEIRNLSF